MAVRLLLVIAIVAGAAVAAYGLFVEKTQQVAFATAGLFVLGVALAVSGLLLGSSAISAGRDGRGGKGLVLAFLGGVCLLAAAGALAGAVVFAVVVLI